MGIDEGIIIKINHEEFIPSSFCDADTQTETTGEMLDRMEAERKEMREEKERVARERDELSRELKRFQHVAKIKNLTL